MIFFLPLILPVVRQLTIATVTLQVGGIASGDEFGEGYCVVPGAEAEREKTEKSFTRRRP